MPKDTQDLTEAEIIQSAIEVGISVITRSTGKDRVEGATALLTGLVAHLAEKDPIATTYLLRAFAHDTYRIADPASFSPRQLTQIAEQIVRQTHQLKRAELKTGNSHG